MNISLKNNQGRKVEFAKRALIRMVQDSGLKIGDKLPGHEQLQRELQLSGTTIFRAVQQLRDEGIFEVRNKVGTFVKSADLALKIGRSIGLVIPRVSCVPSPFYSCLTLFLHHALIANGCLPVPFLNCESLSTKACSIEEFPGLKQAVLDEKIDGIIDLACVELPRSGEIPLVYVGSPTRARQGIFIDVHDFVEQAMRRAKLCGKKRPALIYSKGNLTDESVANFRKSVHLFGFDPASADLHFGAFAICEGRNLAPQLAALPAAKRPDALIFQDEFVGNDLLAGLLVGGTVDRDNYRPTIITHCNDELPLTIPWDDIIYFNMSLSELATQAVKRLLQIEQGNPPRHAIEYWRFSELPKHAFFQEPDAKRKPQCEFEISQTL